MNEIVVSEIQVLPVKPQNGLVAFASAVINNQFYVGSIAIHTSLSSSDGFRLVYPMKTLANGKRVNCFHPISKEVGRFIHQQIINKYTNLIENVNKQHEKVNPSI